MSFAPERWREELGPKAERDHSEIIGASMAVHALWV